VRRSDTWKVWAVAVSDVPVAIDAGPDRYGERPSLLAWDISI
jgi:hypothetical protein